ncbi:MAG: hypothetical protein ABJB74_16720 [Gemmatimonas sp.]
MTRNVLLVITAAIATSVPSAARAQWEAVPVGVRVQVLVENRTSTTNAGRTSLVQGLLERTGDTLFVSPSEPGAAVLIPLASVKGFAVSKGVPSRQRSMIRGAISGTVVGALASVSLILGLKNKGVSNRDIFAATTYLGALGGATTGWTTQRERWDWRERR